MAPDVEPVVRPGPARDQPLDPHVLVVASPRADLVTGLFAGLLLRPDVVQVAHRAAPIGGLVSGEAWFASADGAGIAAAHLKHGGYRVLFNPVVRDEAFDARFRGPVEPFALPLGIAMPTERYVGGHGVEWAPGPARGSGPSAAGRKLCLATTDPERLERVVAAVLAHPAAWGAKTNVDGVDKASWFGRVAFADPAAAGWMCRQLQQRCPEVNPAVQDDDWFGRFRPSRRRS